MDLGQSFSPANQQQDPNVARRKRTPVQQALQTVSLQLPTATGGAGAADMGAGGAMGGAPTSIGADLLSGRSGSIARGSASQPRTQALLNAMMASGAAGTQGITARGGGFAGGGFGDLGKFKPPTAEAGGGAPVGGGGGRAPGGGLADLISKLPGLMPGGLPNLPGMPSPGKPGVGAKPGKPGVPGIPPSLKPPVATKPKLPPINPNIPGGGLVDRLPGVPTPPVNFNRGQDPRFNTPIAQVPNQPPPGNTGITGGMQPGYAPAPPPPPPQQMYYTGPGVQAGGGPAFNPYGKAALTPQQQQDMINSGHADWMGTSLGRQWA